MTTAAGLGQLVRQQAATTKARDDHHRWLELVDAEKRASVVDAHRDLVSRAREFDGCIHVAITADSVDPERIVSVEVWRDAEALEQWRGQADAPDVEETKYMSVKRYDATDGGRLFGADVARNCQHRLLTWE